MLRQSFASTSKFVRPVPRQFRGYRTKTPNPAQDLGDNQNALLMDYLKQLHDSKATPVNDALESIRSTKSPIQTLSDIKEFSKLGTPVKDAITAWLEKSEYVGTAVLMQGVNELVQIPGIGTLRAAEFVKAGARTIDDLRKPELHSLLTGPQKTYVDFRSVFHKTTDLQTAHRIQDAIKSALRPTMEVILCGEHRRGANRAQCTQLVVIDPEHTHVPTPAATGGTGYFCVSKAEAVKGNTALSTVEMLTRRGICAAELRFSTHKWGGLVRIPGKTEDGEWEIQSERLKGVSEHTGDFRRVDMSFVPAKSRGAAMITCTGDEALISHLRKEAEKLDLCLSEFGLWRMKGTEGGTKARKNPNNWELIPAETEEAIFAEIGLDFIEPEMRNFGFLQTGRKQPSRKKY